MTRTTSGSYDVQSLVFCVVIFGHYFSFFFDYIVLSVLLCFTLERLESCINPGYDKDPGYDKETGVLYQSRL